MNDRSTELSGANYEEIFAEYSVIQENGNQVNIS